MTTTPNIAAALAFLLADELANHRAMVREAQAKGREDEMPADATLTTAADSLAQMPDDIVEAISGMSAEEVRPAFAAMVSFHGPNADAGAVLDLISF